MFPAKKYFFLNLDFGTWIYKDKSIEKSIMSYDALLNAELLIFTNYCTEHILHKTKKLWSHD